MAAILAGAALRPVGRWRHRAVARAAAATLRADLARARSHGVLRGETVTVVLDTLDPGWRVTAGDGSPLLERRLDGGLAIVTTAHR